MTFQPFPNISGIPTFNKGPLFNQTPEAQLLVERTHIIFNQTEGKCRRMHLFRVRLKNIIILLNNYICRVFFV